MRKQQIVACLIAAAFLVSAMTRAQQTPTAPPAASSTLDVIPDKMPFSNTYGAPIGATRAQQLIQAAVAEATKRGWAMNIAVMDSGANLVAFLRMDGAQLASIPIAEHKARAAASFRRETKVMEDNIQLKQAYYTL